MRSSREIPLFADAQGVAISGGTALVADVGRRQLIALNLESGWTDQVAGTADGSSRRPLHTGRVLPRLLRR
jgi:hypothetical protein